MFNHNLHLQPHSMRSLRKQGILFQLIKIPDIRLRLSSMQASLCFGRYDPLDLGNSSFLTYFAA